MDFGSLLRPNKSKKVQIRPRTFSTSNLSCSSNSSTNTSTTTTFGRKSIYLTLPQNLGAEVDENGKIYSITKGGSAHSSGVIQLGDCVQIVEKDEGEELISVRVIFGVLHVEQRPNYPFVIEIGNRSQTSLGIALMDSPGNKIRISSILPGSLVDRCGYLRAGDILTSVHISPDETVPCSYYTSQQVAKILRTIVQNTKSVVLTIFPDSSTTTTIAETSCCENNFGNLIAGDDDDNSSDVSNQSNVTLRNARVASPFLDNHYSNTGEFDGGRSCRRMDAHSDKKILNVCLWKDFLYEDWGFSLIDEDNAGVDCDNGDEECTNDGGRGARILKSDERGCGALVQEIRAGGSAYMAGLRTGDKILQINGRDVSSLKSTILVPILASLEDALNLAVLR